MGLHFDKLSDRWRWLSETGGGELRDRWWWWWLSDRWWWLRDRLYLRGRQLAGGSGLAVGTPVGVAERGGVGTEFAPLDPGAAAQTALTVA